jgi:DNA-binding transcriptional MerR regulator/quercetin dioxygenase-like cupin family protein
MTANKTPLYYQIGEAARLLDISASCLRNWERMGLIAAARSQGRYRLYSSETVSRLREIKHLRTVLRVNPAGIRAMLRNDGKEVPRQAQAKPKQLAVAEKLLQLRRERGLTLAATAERTGVSVSYLSSLERGYATPAIATLQKLARLYETNVLSFFSEEDDPRRLVRPRDRKVLVPNPGVRMELLAVGKKVMEPHLFRIAPGATSGGSYSHDGEEFIYVLQGKLEVWLDEVEQYFLEPRDSLYFDSRQAHRWSSLSEKETLLIWVNTPATF